MLGFSSPSLTSFVVTRTLALAIFGGLIGVISGSLDIVLLTEVVVPRFEFTLVAILDSAVDGSGIGITVFAGVLAFCTRSCWHAERRRSRS